VKKKHQDWWLIGRVETRFWNFDKDLLPFVDKVVGVYAFNRAEVTHCCEVTPSFTLWSMGDYVVPKPDTPDAIQEKLDDFINSASKDSDPSYVHCRGIIKQLRSRAAPRRVYRVGFVDEEELETQLDHVRDIWNSNPKFFL